MICAFEKQSKSNATIAVRVKALMKNTGPISRRTYGTLSSTLSAADSLGHRNGGGGPPLIGSFCSFIPFVLPIVLSDWSTSLSLSFLYSVSVLLVIPPLMMVDEMLTKNSGNKRCFLGTVFSITKYYTFQASKLYLRCLLKIFHHYHPHSHHHHFYVVITFEI